MFTLANIGVFNKNSFESTGLRFLLSTIVLDSVVQIALELPSTLTLTFDRDLTTEEQASVTAAVAAHNPSLLTESVHDELRGLPHDFTQTGFTEIVRSAGKVASVTVYRSASKTRRLRETITTRAAGKVASILINQFDESDTIIDSVNQTFTRVSNKLETIDSE